MKRAAAPALLFLVILGAYLANGRTIGAGDTLPARYLPWSILQHRSMTLDPFPSLYDEAAVRAFPVLDGIPYYLLRRNGHYVSTYTPGPSVLALPVLLLSGEAAAREITSYSPVTDQRLANPEPGNWLMYRQMWNRNAPLQRETPPGDAPADEPA